MTDDKKYQVMPDLTDEEYAELKADIAERGVMVPIEFDEDGNILDGHHRMRACEELGIKDYPRVVRAGMTEEQKIEHALLVNVARRNLSPSDKRLVAQKLVDQHPEFSFQRIADILGFSKSTAHRIATVPDGTVANHVGLDGKARPASESQAQEQREIIRDMISENPGMNNHQIAQAVGASDHTVAKQREVVDHVVSVFNPSSRDAEALKDPDIQRRLAENDKMNVAGAIREQTRDNLIEHLESVETKEAKAVEGVYDVIVIDPPWPMQKIEMDARPHATEFDYPTMNIDEIKSLKLPAAEDCHVFLWTTQRFYMNGDALDILKAWGVKPVWCFVWTKDNGPKPFGLPKSNVEFVLYGHIGSPKFVNEKDFWSSITAPGKIMPITGHSEKPEGFYNMVRRVTAGRRLDMFNRRAIDGFDVWGKEAAECTM